MNKHIEYQEAINKLKTMGDKDLYNEVHLKWLETIQELLENYKKIPTFEEFIDLSSKLVADKAIELTDEIMRFFSRWDKEENILTLYITISGALLNIINVISAKIYGYGKFLGEENE